MKKATLQIDGMHCAGCVNAVDKQLESLEGVKSARVNLATESAIVEYEGEISMDDFAEVISKGGYTLVRDDSATTSKADQAEEREQRKYDTSQHALFMDPHGHYVALDAPHVDRRLYVFGACRHGAGDDLTVRVCHFCTGLGDHKERVEINP